MNSSEGHSPYLLLKKYTTVYQNRPKLNLHGGETSADNFFALQKEASHPNLNLLLPHTVCVHGAGVSGKGFLGREIENHITVLREGNGN